MERASSGAHASWQPRNATRRKSSIGTRNKNQMQRRRERENQAQGTIPAADKNLAGGNGDCRRRNRTDGVPSTRSQKNRGSNKTWARKSQLLRWRPATGQTTQVNHEERGRWDRVPRDEIEKIAWWRGPARKQELQPDLTGGR
jgi:hypothetical protein